MRKFFNIVSHPILITIILITLYYIGVYNNYFKAIENFKIHLFYLILIAICLGFISGFHFIKKMNKDKYSNYKRIFSEGINEDDSTFLNSNYTDHLIYFVEKNYTHYQMSFIFSIYFFISLLSLYDEIYINENFIAYAFNCYYFVVFLPPSGLLQSIASALQASQCYGLPARQNILLLSPCLRCLFPDE